MNAVLTKGKVLCGVTLTVCAAFVSGCHLHLHLFEQGGTCGPAPQITSSPCANMQDKRTADPLSTMRDEELRKLEDEKRGFKQ